MRTPRITARHVERAKLTAAKYFGIMISDQHARRLLEIDRTLLPELNDDGSLDTAPRDYFGMALIEMVMPGRPSAQDSLIGSEQDRWHWPCNGSDNRYMNAFAKALRSGLARHGIEPIADRPLKWTKAAYHHQETHCGRYGVWPDSIGRWHAYRLDMDEPMTGDGFRTRWEAKAFCEADARTVNREAT